MDQPADDEFDRWKSEQWLAIVRLHELVENKRDAIHGLIRMSNQDWSIPVPIGITATGPSDTTHIIEDYNRWIAVVNRACTDAGIQAITAALEKDLAWIDAVQKLSSAFDGTGPATRQQAWWYLLQVDRYLANERQKRLAMDRYNDIGRQR